MTETNTIIQQPSGVGIKTDAAPKRYKVSRKGMGGRKPIYTREFLEGLVNEKLENGTSIKAQCRALSKPYISIYMALKNTGLIIPKVDRAASKVFKTTDAPQVVVMPDVSPNP